MQSQYIKDVKLAEDYEIGLGLEELMKQIDQPFKQNLLSQRFVDLKLEEEFQKWLHPTITQCGKVFIWELMAMVVLIIFAQGLKLLKLGGNYPPFKWVMLVVFVGAITAVALYLFSRKYLRVALQFSNMASLVLTIIWIETEMQATIIYYDGGGCALMVALIGATSILSYCQLQLLLTYILCLIYATLRIYTLGELDLKFIVFMLTFASAYGFMYVFSRFFQQRERDKFKTYHQQRNLIKLFHNLIKVFHDGILITQDQNIVFYNKQISSLFNINVDPNENTEINADGCEQQKTDKTAIEEKKKLIVQSLRDSNLQRGKLEDTAVETENQCSYSNIWEFIQEKNSKNCADENSERITCEADFKFRSQASDGGKLKLKAFTQNITSGETQLVMTSIREMSVWIELEKQKNLSSMKTIAFASAAHEFRNPLNAINTSLQLLENSAFKPQDLLYFNTAKDCSKLMLNLVKDILDLSQIEAKSLILNFSEVNIIELIKGCLSMFSFKAKEKGIELSINANEDIPEMLCTDEGRLQQILINLVSNSLKYTTQGFVRISCANDFENDHIKIIVEDSGVGMDQDQVNSLFQYFTKIMSNRHLNKEGVGLGLNISLRLAKALGGDIAVTSERGVGSSFILRLPINKNQSNHLKNSPFETNNLIMNSFDQSFTSFQEQDVLFQYTTSKRNTTALISAFKDLSPQHRRQLQEKEGCADKGSSKNFGLLAEDIEMQFSLVCKCAKVLIVDDEPFNLIIQQGILQQYNIENADTAYNGQEALKKIEENSQMSCRDHEPYRLITLDNNMPLMNGFQTAEMIRIRQKQKLIDSNLRIAMVTGDEHLLHDQQYKNVFDYLLVKPIERNHFQAMLREIQL